MIKVGMIKVGSIKDDYDEGRSIEDCYDEGREYKG